MAKIGSASIEFTAEDRNVESSFKKLENSFIKLRKSGDVFQAGVGKSTKAVTGLGNSFTSLAKSVGGVIVAYVGLRKAFDLTIGSTIKFQQEIANINTLLGLTSDEAVKFGDDVRAIGKRVPIDNALLTPALYDIVSSGISDTSKALQILEGSARLASAGLGTVQQAADLVTSATNAFNLEGEQLDNVFNTIFQAVKTGKTTIAGLSDGFGAVAGTVAAAGIEFDDFLSSVAALTTQGLPAAQAYTFLRGAIVGLTRDSTRADGALAKLGFDTFPELVKQSGGLSNALRAVTGAYDGNEKALLKVFGRIEGYNAAIALSGSVQEAQINTLKAMRENLDSLDIAFETQKGTVIGLAKILKNQLTDVFQDMTENVLPSFGKFLLFLVENFDELRGKATQVTQEIVALVKPFIDLGIALVKISGSIIKVVDEFVGLKNVIQFAGAALVASFGVSKIRGIIASFSALNVSITAYSLALKRAQVANVLAGNSISKIGISLASLSNPIGIAVAGFTALTFAYIKLKGRSLEVQKASEDLANSLKDIGKAGFDTQDFEDSIDGLVEKLRKARDEMGLVISGRDQMEFNVEFGGDVQQLRDQYTEFLESLGATDEAIEQATKGLTFFKGVLAPTEKDLEKMKETTEALSIPLNRISTDFNSAANTMIIGGRSIQDAFSDVAKSMEDDFIEISRDAEKVPQTIVDSFLVNVAKMEGVGEAFVFAAGEGITNTRARSILEKSGTVVSNGFIATLLDKSIEAKDVGETYGLLLALGIETSKSEVEANAGNLADFVTKKLISKSSEIEKAGEIVGRASVIGIVKGIISQSPDLTRAVDLVQEAFNPLLKFGSIFTGSSKEVANDAKDVISELEKLKNTSLSLDAGGGGGVSAGASATNDALKETETRIDQINKRYEAWRDGIKKTTESIEKLKEKNAELMKGVSESIRDTVDDITDLQGAFDETTKERDTSFFTEIAEKLIEARSEMESLNDQINNSSDLSDERRKQLKEELKIQREIEQSSLKILINQAGGNIKDSTFVNEAEKLDGLNEVELLAEQNRKKEEQRLADFNAEKAILDEKKLLLEQFYAGEEIKLDEIKNRDNLRLIEELQNKQNQINLDLKLEEQRQKGLENAWKIGGAAILRVNDDIIAKLDAKYQALAKRIKSALSKATGTSGGGGGAGFKEGGFTPAGNTGDVAGVVHKGEYVIPSKVLKSIAPTGILGVFENMRRGMKGFANGGFTSSDLLKKVGGDTTNNNQVTINQDNKINENIDMEGMGQELLFLLQSNQS